MPKKIISKTKVWIPIQALVKLKKSKNTSLSKKKEDSFFYFDFACGGPSSRGS